MDREVGSRRMTPAQRDDLLTQKAIFENQYPNFAEGLQGKIVGFAHGRPYVGTTVHELLDAVKREYPGSMLYFEPLGFDIV
jgi:hypothetical protein